MEDVVQMWLQNGGWFVTQEVANLPIDMRTLGPIGVAPIVASMELACRVFCCRCRRRSLAISLADLSYPASSALSTLPGSHLQGCA